jgi:hypothetical protein
MTLIVDILARAARQCSVVPPSSWLTATDQTALEILDFMDETRADIMGRVDVVGPMSVTTTVAGNGGESYALPADFMRLHRGDFAVYERFRTRRACVPVSSDGEWEYLKELGSGGAYRFYRLRGYEGNWEIDFQLPLETGITVVVGYVSRNWIAGGKPTFTDATDVSLLPRRLVEQGIVWRFRRRKALEYADAMAEYEMLMSRYSNDSRTRRSINFGSPVSRGPFDIPVPDVIPSN